MAEQAAVLQAIEVQREMPEVGHGSGEPGDDVAVRPAIGRGLQIEVEARCFLQDAGKSLKCRLSEGELTWRDEVLLRKTLGPELVK